VQPDPQFDRYMTLLGRFLRLSGRQRDDIRRELEAHLEEALEDAAARGLPREQVLEQVLEDFGDAAELAARFSIVGRRKRWIMRTAATAACLGAAAIGTTFFNRPDATPRDEAARAFVGSVPAATVVAPRAPDDPARKALAAVIPDGSFEGIVLKEVVGYLAEQARSAGTQLLVRWEALETMNISSDHLVTVQFKGTTLDQALWMLTNSLSESPLEYTTYEGFIILSTREDLNRYQSIVVYDVRDLVELTSRSPGRVAALLSGNTGDDLRTKAIVEFSRSMLEGAGPAKSSDPLTTASPAARAGGDVGELLLIDILTSIVEPNSWSDNGGEGAIRGFPGALVVRQTSGTHEEVARLLATLREGMGSPAAGR